MRIGGNKNAQAYFRKQGMKDLHSKIEKKYTSKVANAYKAELKKLVDAEAAKRDGGAAAAAAEGADASADLLANLELAEKAGVDDEARAKLAAARASQSGVAVPQAKLASTLAGASKLVVTPPSSGGAPKLVLRKPAGSNKNSYNMMKKKPTASTNKMKISKLGVKPPAGEATATTDDFDSFETPQKEAPAADAPVAPPVVVPAPAPPPVAAAPAPPKEFSMKDGVDKLKGMNSDFFSNF